MGLLDSVLGAVLGGGQQQQAPAAAGGLGSLIGLLASNPQILSTITGMLSNDGGQGGLGGLVGKFQQAGMGDAIGSWIGTGANQPVTGDQLGNVLGEDALSGLAQVLPELINHMTPTGQAPTTGLGNAGDLMGMLGGLLNQKA